MDGELAPIELPEITQLIKKYVNKRILKLNNRFLKEIPLLTDCELVFIKCQGTKLTLERCSGDVQFIDCQFDELEVNSNDGISKFMYSGTITKSLTFKDPVEELLIKNSRIATLGLPPSNSKKISKVRNTNIGNLLIHEVAQNLILDTVSIENTFGVTKCAFDETVIFQNVNLFNATFAMSGSSITRAKYHSIRWMRDYSITLPYLLPNLYDTGTNETSKVELWVLQEAYRQLKVISLGFENKIDAKHFQSKELKTYYRSKKRDAFKSFHFSKLITKQFWNDTATWLLLGTNKWFSNFGDSYFTPLRWLFGVHFLFIWLGFNLFGAEINWTHPDWDVTWKTIGLYLYTLSPVHDLQLKDIYGNVMPSNLTADFFMRIFAGYFIYYFLKTTRQYNFNV